MKGHRYSSVQLRIIIIFVVGLFVILQSPKFAQSAGNFNPLCNSYNEVIKTNLEAIAFAKEKAFEPGYIVSSRNWDIVFNSDTYKNPTKIGTRVNGILWTVGRDDKKYFVSFNYDDGEIYAFITADFTPCGSFLDKGHILTASTNPEYRGKQ